MGVHLIMTSLDEGGIQCLDQSNFNMVTLFVLYPQSQHIAFDTTEPEQSTTICMYTHIHIVLGSLIGLCILAKDFL